jgi:hypothetical protein
MLPIESIGRRETCSKAFISRADGHIGMAVQSAVHHALAEAKETGIARGLVR